MKNAGAIAAMLGGLILAAAALRDRPADGPEPRPSADVLDVAYQVDRAGRVKILREMASRDFPSDKAKKDWHNQQTDGLRQTAFEPYIEQLADHLMAGTVAEFADELEQ